MSYSPRTKAGCLITLLIVFSLGVGFTLGIIVSKGIQKKKEDPAFWKQQAMKHLEKLHPAEAQRPRLEAHTDKAVAELTELREEGIRQVWEIVTRAAQDIEKELTPEQKEVFEKIRPKPPAGKAP
ncbi:hypothetical protein [Prosthecobacter dejongeii]|uniref:Uncharacterized protein n=1 Tax=Prosthecobacter dejongeii TaxID=48465 RepID=A0A7W8DNC7_9BACT|nr:hypothetical protein [Prosthecobacter dejongeii]MBB5036409.1 hypothetical protein [Prosthecobacter dejongeii]